jgi:two-component system, cell cycle sensor histidine kinase and response regulator CckA
MNKVRILFVEDDAVDQISFKRFIAEHELPYEFTMAGTIADAKAHLLTREWDIVIADYNLGDGTALDLVEFLNGHPLVVTTGAGSEETALKALKAGAYDYLIKDYQRNYLTVVPVTIERALERHHAEQQMKMLLHAVMNITDSVYITDTAGRIIFVNKAFCHTYGYPEKDVLGRPARMFEGSGRESECEYARPDGSVFSVSLSRSSLCDESGREVAMVTVARDITERRRVEDALRASEEQYHRFFDDDLAGDFIATPDGRLLACNRSFAAILGFSSVEDALRYNLNSLFDSPTAGADFLELLRFNRKLERHEMKYRRIDGHPAYVIQNVIGSFDEGDHLLLIKGYMFDNTQQKRLEDRLRQAQKMESIGTLAGGIAHDFNNILAIILGHVSLLDQVGTDSKVLPRCVTGITSAVQRGANLVKQILTFARKDDVEFTPIEMNSLVQEMARLLNETFPKSIAFCLNLDPEVPTTVADHSQLHQVLLNLCVNARDAMPAVGTITISTGLVAGPHLRERFADALQHQYIVVRISDTGVGIPEEIRGKIFEPFFTTKEVGKGTGLGLSVAYGVAKNHQGYLDVESEVGAGTTFSLYLPVVKTKVPVPELSMPTAEEQPADKGTILLVEDEELLLDLVKGFLETNGYEVIAARDGEEAVALYATNMDRIGLVLTDLGLPRLDGWGAFLRMRDLNPKIKVIVASGHIEPGMRATMLHAGATELVQKPYLPKEVLTRVRSQMRESSGSRRN